MTNDLTQKIAEDNRLREAALSCYATKDSDAVRAAKKDYTVLRGGFIRDCEAIINLTQFNRYANKTQVFSLHKNNDISNRSYHVQLVSRISRTIGSALGLNLNLLEAIALAHDFGHPPFGHKGEEFLNSITQNYGYTFKHHFQSARYLFELNKGSNFSYQVIDGVLGHNGEILNQSYTPAQVPNRPFDALAEKLEACYQGNITDNQLKPCTLEGCLVRIADVIAYIGKDRQDAIKLGLENTFAARNRDIIASFSNDIVNNSYGKNYIAMSDNAYAQLKSLQAENYKKIYKTEKVVSVYEDIPKIYNSIFDFLYKDATSDMSVLRNCYLKYLDYAKGADAYCLKNKNYPERICADFISSMCDDYMLSFYEFFKKDNPLWQENVKKIDYFE